ncbi:hypothetical protein B0H12DRAFT_1311528 [Mycena haematopus]|nr:hypothetical protein B0H12DRAFT_1311528 [Mycena haematopus]
MSSVSGQSSGVSGSQSSASVGASSSGGAPSSSGPQTFPATLPPGFASITQPPQTATSFFKIAENQLITIAWNFTSVLATPTSLTLSAVWTTGTRTPIPGTATSVVWDVFSYNQAHPGTQLAQASYTLHMWDDRGPTATVEAGYMTPNTALSFAMYTPQAYTPIASGWTCTGCSAALTTRPALGGVLLALLLVLFSGLGVLRRAAGRAS